MKSAGVRKKRKNKVEKGQLNAVEEKAGEWWLDEQTLENGETERCKYLGY